MNEKFWKKFQMFLLIASFDGVNFKIFHQHITHEKIITKLQKLETLNLYISATRFDLDNSRTWGSSMDPYLPEYIGAFRAHELFFFVSQCYKSTYDEYKQLRSFFLLYRKVVYQIISVLIANRLTSDFKVT